MTLVSEKCGSLSTRWIRSCLSCLYFIEDSQGGQHGEKGDVQQEMQVCHTQPHLMPPMRLVGYDDLSSPSIRQNRNSIPSWIMEGKELVSRASNRASMSMPWKRHTTTPLKISGPSQFRRVQSFHPQATSMDYSLTSYHPLELSIHKAGNRLSDLPSFENFQLDEDHHYQTLIVPRRTLSPTTIRTRRCQSAVGGSAVTRKPVGSGDRRSLGNIKPVIERPRPVRIASGLIPYFSIVNPVQPALSENYVPNPVHARSKSEGHDMKFATEWSGHTSTPEAPSEFFPRTPPARKELEGDTRDGEAIDRPFLHGSPLSRDSPSTASSRTLPSRISNLTRPSLSPINNRRNMASMPLPHRVSQWFFPNKTPLSKSAPPAGDLNFNWQRTRTLSGTTVTSTITTTVTGGAKVRKPNVSVSSTLTSFTTPRSSLRGASPTEDKELDVAGYQPTISENKPRPFSYFPSHALEQIGFRNPFMSTAF